MAGKLFSASCGLSAVFLSLGICCAALGQVAISVAETSPPATAQPGAYWSDTTYAPWQTAEHAYRMAQQQRRLAVDYQLQTIAAVRTYGAWGSRYGVTVTVPRVYVYRPRRAVRRAYRYGYVEGILRGCRDSSNHDRCPMDRIRN